MALRNRDSYLSIENESTIYESFSNKRIKLNPSKKVYDEVSKHIPMSSVITIVSEDNSVIANAGTLVGNKKWKIVERTSDYIDQRFDQLFKKIEEQNIRIEEQNIRIEEQNIRIEEQSKEIVRLNNENKRLSIRIEKLESENIVLKKYVDRLARKDVIISIAEFLKFIYDKDPNEDYKSGRFYARKDCVEDFIDCLDDKEKILITTAKKLKNIVSSFCLKANKIIDNRNTFAHFDVSENLNTIMENILEYFEDFPKELNTADMKFCYLIASKYDTLVEIFN